ncbi:hypothetical protein IJH29_01835 [Candidatus Saccharibacteria bacterium]|nr:hypothetical protein [Candidatus Saccharibacteria bacterium]
MSNLLIMDQEGEIRIRDVLGGSADKIIKKHQQANALHYWTLLRKVVDNYADYVSRYKLYLDVSGNSTSPKAKKVFNDKFSGNLQTLQGRYNTLHWLYQESFRNFCDFCYKIHVASISREALEALIEDKEPRRRFRRAIDKHIEREDAPFPASDIPARDYKKKRAD